MNKIIVYGLGKEFLKQRKYLESYFDIVGYCDKQKKEMGGYLAPNELNNFEYDYIYVTSINYYEDIKNELIKFYNVKPEKIIGKKEWLGDFENAKEKEKWVVEKLQNIPEGSIILDAGAGELKYAPYCKHLKYISQDFGEYNAEQDPVKITTKNSWDTSKVSIVSDIIDMPLESESIDYILCTEVFEHLKNPVLAVEEFSRLLKRGGKLILTAPFCSLTHMAPYYFSNGFSEFWYKEHLSDYGFQIEEIKRNGNFYKYLCQELLRVNDISMAYCNSEITVEETKNIIETIKILMKLSQKDIGSDDVLCFGYMLVAKKY